MLESLVKIYRFVTWYIYIYDIADMICHIFQYYIQQQHDENWKQLCQHLWVSISADKYYLIQGKKAIFYVSSYLQLIPTKNKYLRCIYVKRWFICQSFIGLIICGSNIQHSMLAYQKKIKVYIKTKCKGILPTFMLNIWWIYTVLAPNVYVDIVVHIMC